MLKKHELQIGMPGAFYFDENSPKISVPLPSHLSYFYKLNNDYNIRIGYDYYSISTDSEEPYKIGQTLSRRFNEYSLGVGKNGWI
ncbi:MAG: hypothetical protein HC803_08220 [Saprospiraceae bacterium]|nr:hypothetical protein [Saprospiraceae bacterium]